MVNANIFLIYPASHYVTSKEHMKEAIDSIQEELQQQLKILEDDNKILRSSTFETTHKL